MARVREIAWTLFHLEDIRSDMSVLHRIDEVEEMPGPRYFAYCHRLRSYQGAVAAAARAQQERREQRRSAPPMSVADWARAHPAAMQAAHEELREGR